MRQNVFEVAAAEDHQPGETLVADGADESLRVGVRLRRLHGGVDDLDAFAAEHLVERGGELAVAIVDQETHPLENVGAAEGVRLLKDPRSGLVRCATGKMDTPAPELDEEQHIETTQRDRLDREEVAGEQTRRLTAQKGRPSHRVTARRGLEPGRGKQTPNRAWRDTETELQQLARDPLIAPTRVLARQPQHQIARRAHRRGTAALALPVRPPPAPDLALPAPTL